MDVGALVNLVVAFALLLVGGVSGLVPILLDRQKRRRSVILRSYCAFFITILLIVVVAGSILVGVFPDLPSAAVDRVDEGLKGIRARAAPDRYSQLADLIGIPGSRISPLEVQLRELVEHSQIQYRIGVCGAPNRVNLTSLYKYFVSEEEGGLAIKEVLRSAKLLRQKGWHCGSGSTLLVLDFFSFRPLGVGYAKIRTTQKWLLPLYEADETRVKGTSAEFGPYQIEYTFKSKNGKWLIDASTTIIE